ncbi:MAG: DUF4199 domain-containing protein [Leeuwenhoekiella sp.]|nr:DUF4199 domain-containing protein [Leeuwenhoekiella sp.]
MINPRLELKWASIYILFLFLWMGFERFAGWHDQLIDRHHIYTLLFYIPAIGIYFIALIDKRNNFYGGIITYKQSFLTGLVLTILITILAIPAQYIISTYISPHYFENVIKYAVTSGKATLEEANEFFNLKSYIIQAVVGSLVFGILISSIVSVFIRRK